MSGARTDRSAAIVDKLEELVGVVHKCGSAVRFMPIEQRHLYATTLHATVVELAAGCVRLLRRRDGTCSPLLLRSALEAYVDLHNLVDDLNYPDHLLAEWQYQRSRVLKSAVNRGAQNPYLINLAGNPQLQQGLDEAEAELKRLSNAGRGRLSVRDRFDRVGELDRYESVYAHLCWRSHNNLPALAERHIEVAADGSREVVYFRPMDESTIQMYADTLAHIVANSYDLLTEVLGNGHTCLEDIREAMKELEALYPETTHSP